MADYHELLDRVERILERAEHWFPTPPAQADWRRAAAFRWRRVGARGFLEGVPHPHRIRLADLHGIDDQKADLVRNTRQFLAGLPANNVLLWGARGTGKSSLIKALLTRFRSDGLRLIQVNKEHLLDLPDLLPLLEPRPERFVVFADDLSFAAGDAGYRALKAVLEGAVSALPDNVLLYATSNRRHLLPETIQENLETRLVEQEIHHGEGVEEKISLSERFGLWLAFHPFSQERYLEIVFHWLKRMKTPVPDREAVLRAALQWALTRGSRSGRVAWQFARDWAGRTGLRA
ncbi:MAG: AAA family ATPase [Chromatiales bacterium 21-64-14]|nr:MAG: AAA family ATPase [Chromatiales bacterium 21-64-14]HQU16914.1 ATP-binding protein [Gammaproteobacteria bacterium]